MPSAFRPLPLLPRPWVPPLRPADADADDCLLLLRPPRPRPPRPLGAEIHIREKAACKILAFIELPPPVSLCISSSQYAGFST
ncbi:Os03g0165025 [Oryza sativa Japonica Group]|uniref:Os03g0165025 protein n=1 Tax=Oryza sativa subsp. japonica TaxID=39947 RepID=A0A0P0VTD8_ORYSJ|nr:hypothetical protein EE612_015504 [Oryza sativa]BAS82458.1 Os03g0165025 [Oryza sativa Japonica Group]